MSRHAKLFGALALRALPLGTLALGSACASERRLAAATPELDVRPIPAPSAKAVAPEPTCDERDPTPDAVPATPPPAAFTQIDAEIRGVQDRPGKYVYAGSVADLFGDGRGTRGRYQLDVQDVTALRRRLEREIVNVSESPEWSLVARVRSAEMLERVRDGLANVTVYAGPAPAAAGQVALLTPQQASLIAQMKTVQRLGTKGDELLEATLEFFTQKKKQELDGINESILTSYAGAARFAPTKAPAATRAVRRLAHYETDLGPWKMATLLGRDYVPGMYRRQCADLGPGPPSLRAP